MHIRTLTILLPLLALAACAQHDKTPSPANAPDTVPAHADATVASSAALAGYQWKLESATDAQGKRIDALFPEGGNGLVLGFTGDAANVSGGCNGMGGTYTLDATGQLAIGPMRSTMKACAPPLMQADEAIGALLAKPQQARIEDAASPRLQLTSAAGETSNWIGQATAEKRYGGPGETVFMEIAPQRIACSHPLIPNHQCLQVRDIHYGENGVKQAPGEWKAFYGEIEGFEFQPGERKVLRLKKFTKPDPVPADASSIAYVLDMVVESEIVPKPKQP